MVQALKRRTAISHTRAPERRENALRYDSPSWRRLSLAFIQAHPFCVLCLAHGRVNQGAQEFHSDEQRNLVVDHIVPHRDDPTLYWDQDNWEVLCRFPCHTKDKSRCEHQHKDWWSYVRGLIQENKTQDFVSQYRQWLPEHVKEAIGCA